MLAIEPAVDEHGAVQDPDSARVKVSSHVVENNSDVTLGIRLGARGVARRPGAELKLAHATGDRAIRRPCFEQSSMFVGWVEPAAQQSSQVWTAQKVVETIRQILSWTAPAARAPLQPISRAPLFRKTGIWSSRPTAGASRLHCGATRAEVISTSTDVIPSLIFSARIPSHTTKSVVFVPTKYRVA